MRAALWLVALFGAAAAVSLFAGSNQGSVTLFWPPYRIDLSLNLVLVLLLLGFVTVHAALRGLSALRQLPRQARHWRLLQKERRMHATLLDAMAQLLAGRFVRARKSAQTCIEQELGLRNANAPLPEGTLLRTLAHLVAAESAHALQDRTNRQAHLEHALASLPANPEVADQALHEGVQLRAARWLLDERDSAAALEQLAQLPSGVARRTLALRARLKAARLAQQHDLALETARLLAKHGAFTGTTATTLMGSLAQSWLDSARDPAQLEHIWHQQLEAGERAQPDVAIHAARRLEQLGGGAEQVREWLQPVWERWQTDGGLSDGGLSEHQQAKLVDTLNRNLHGLDAAWLARIEAASQAHPRQPKLHYLAATACLQRQLWGKAHKLLTQSTEQLQDPQLLAQAWRQLAELAEQREDGDSAAQAWKQAALHATPQFQRGRGG